MPNCGLAACYQSAIRHRQELPCCSPVGRSLRTVAGPIATAAREQAQSAGVLLAWAIFPSAAYACSTCGALVTAAAASNLASVSRQNSSSSTSPPSPPPTTCARLAHCVGCFGSPGIVRIPHARFHPHTPHVRAAPKRIAVAFLQRRATLGRRDAAHQHRPPRRPRRSRSTICTPLALDTGPRAGADSTVSRRLHHRLLLAA